MQVEDEFDRYFARAALQNDMQNEADSRRGSLPSTTLIIEPPSAQVRRTASCRYPNRRRRNSSRSPNRRPDTLGVDGDGVSQNYIHESTLRAPSPGANGRPHSAPHSRSSSWKNKRRPRSPRPGETGSFDEQPRSRSGSVTTLEDTVCKLEQLKLLQSEDMLPVRNFTTSSRGLVNRGDSFKRRSNQSVASDAGSVASAPSSLTRSRNQSVNSQTSQRAASQDSPPSSYRVLIVGAHGVGKTALLQQFMTSDYMGAAETSFGMYFQSL